MINLRPIITTACALVVPYASASAERAITNFDSTDNQQLNWTVVDDGVMGGLSKGKLAFSEEGSMLFSGTLSLENNGGFSSVRTGNVELDLSDASGLAMRVRGDGRTYEVRLGTDALHRGMEVSFKADFPTENGEWSEVRLPFESLTGSFRGRSLPEETFDPAKIRRLGFLLADKNPGSFALEVDSIRTYSEAAGGDLASKLVADGRFKTLAAAVGAAGLAEALSSEGELTVFAPTDEAFAKLPEGTVEELLKEENRDKLQSILKYHVVAGASTLGQALSASEIGTLQGAPVTMMFRDGQVRVNEARLVDADLRCSNGIFHVIDSVLLPPKQGPETLAETAQAAGSFQTLLAAVRAAGLFPALESAEALTVLAPTDAAFKALPDGTVESLLKEENRGKLKALLTYHVISGRISAGDALNAGSAATVNGAPLTFAISDGAFKVNGKAKVLTADVTCSNGVIHIIDSVLLPPTASEETPVSNESAGDDCQQSPRERIVAAIDKGVPLFNEGDAAGCASVYEACISDLANDENLDRRVRGMLSGVLKHTSGADNAEARAWILRRTLDGTLAYLSGRAH